MNVLVTGATGFIGQHLVKRLIQEGHTVRCLIRDAEKAKRVLGNKGVEYVVGDITEKETLRNACDNISIVYHLAAIMGHDLPSKSAFDKFRRVNTDGTRNISESCIESGIDKFIYVSSTAAMGLLKDKVVNEETPCNPFTPYQVSKYEGELIVRELTADHGFPGIVLRPSMVYGIGFKGDFLTIAKVVKTGVFPKIGFGRNLSPALYIDDLVACISKAKDRAIVGQTYIISSEESYELERVVRIISEALNVKVRMVFVPKALAILGAWFLESAFLLMGKTPWVTQRNIRSTTTDRVFDVMKAKEELGFRQRVSIEEGLTKTVRYFQDAGYL
jgi:UDP-glucose 4-epimerase